MVDQVMTAHSNLQWFHIGCDEVRNDDNIFQQSRAWHLDWLVWALCCLQAAGFKWLGLERTRKSSAQAGQKCRQRHVCNQWFSIHWHIHTQNKCINLAIHRNQHIMITWVYSCTYSGCFPSFFILFYTYIVFCSVCYHLYLLCVYEGVHEYVCFPATCVPT